jgi:hypothetical protein
MSANTLESTNTLTLLLAQLNELYIYTSVKSALFKVNELKDNLSGIA